VTIDERLEFLLHSTEFLHANSQLLEATAARHDEQLAKVIKGMEITDHRFRELAATVSEIALAVPNHERRLGKLDGAPDAS
jgi:hypothetical protein